MEDEKIVNNEVMQNAHENGKEDVDFYAGINKQSERERDRMRRSETETQTEIRTEKRTERTTRLGKRGRGMGWEENKERVRSRGRD